MGAGISHRDLFFRHVAQTSPSPLAIEVDRAEGLYIYDTSGKKYLDLISGIAVSNLGHSHPRILQAIHEQSGKYLHLLVYGEIVEAPQVQLAQLLCSYLPEKLNQVYFVNSGAEATEGAMKLAKRFTGRSETISFVNAYHGSTQGAISLSGNNLLKHAYRPLLPGNRIIRLNEPGDLQWITNKTAAVFLETIQGEAGVRIPDKEYLQLLRQRCNETGCLLVLDEIQTGLGRTGKLFAFEHFQIEPDILLLAKSFGGGLPLGAFVAPREIMSVLTHDPALGHITTFGGHPLCCAAALAHLQEVIDSKIIQDVKNKEKVFLQNLGTSHAWSVRSAGLLMAIELGNAKTVQEVIQKCLSEGILTDWFLFCDTALRIAPPLIISEKEMQQAAEKIHVILASLLHP